MTARKTGHADEYYGTVALLCFLVRFNHGLQGFQGWVGGATACISSNLARILLGHGSIGGGFLSLGGVAASLDDTLRRQGEDIALVAAE